MAAPVHAGGCQCGAVRFRVTGPLDDASICHCRMCQKAFGAYYAPLVSTRGARLEWTRGEPKRLTPIELQLLRHFVRNEGIVLSRAELLEKVWGVGPSRSLNVGSLRYERVGTRTVDNFVMRLRKLFEADPGNPRHFHSVRGAGYRFTADPEPEE